MLENSYKNSFKEVLEILENTDEELVKKIPICFMDFLKNNMNGDYQTNINKSEPINKQNLLSETNSMLSLIYRSYWATSEEKLEFANKDKEEFKHIEKAKKSQCNDISEIFEKNSNLDKIALTQNLTIIKKENLIKKIFSKILNLLKK